MHRYRNNQESHSRTNYTKEGRSNPKDSNMNRKSNSSYGKSNNTKNKNKSNTSTMKDDSNGFQLQLKTSYDRPMAPQQYKTRREESPSPFDRRRDGRYKGNRRRTSSSSPYTADRHRTSSSSPHPQRNRQQQQQPPRLPLQLQQETVSKSHELNKKSMTEEEYNIQIMRERETEILEINKKMNTVSDIYHDLAGLIDGQQELIDQIDDQIELANEYTKAGNDNYEEARLVHENPIFADPFGEKVGTGNHRRSGEHGYPPPHSHPQQMAGRRKKSRGVHGKKSRSRSRRSSSRRKDNIDCPEAMPDEMQDVLKAGLKDMKELGNRLITACTAPDTNEVNEYAYHSERANTKPQNMYAYRNEQLSQPHW